MEQGDQAVDFAQDFGKDVPAHLQEEVLERIELVAHGLHEDEDISIFDVEHINILNIEFSGTIMIEGQEHCFHMRSGNNNGTEILSWNEGLEFEHEPRQPYALVPHARDVIDAIHAGRAEQFLEKWNQDLDPSTERGSILSELPQKYAYDGFFAPGATNMVHAGKAEQYGYSIMDLDDAFAIRKKLCMEALRIRPINTWPKQTPEEAGDVYAVWSGYRSGGEILDIITAAAERLSRTSSLMATHDEEAALRKHGFRFATLREERDAWKKGLSALYSITDLEGFDPDTLPEDPVKGLFHSFDPELVSDRRVNPQRACAELLDAVTERLTRHGEYQVTEEDREAFKRYGFVLEDKRPICWIVNENGLDVPIYKGEPRDRGADGRTYRIMGDTVIAIEFDHVEDGWLVLGEFDRHETRFSERDEEISGPEV